MKGQLEVIEKMENGENLITVKLTLPESKTEWCRTNWGREIELEELFSANP